MANESDPLLTMSPAEMRDLGYRVIDLLVDHLEGLDELPVGGRLGRSEAEALFREPPPRAPGSPTEVMELLEREVLPNVLQVQHPRFFAFVPSPSNFISVMADTLASGFNVFCGTWLGGSAAAEIELVTIDWLKQLCGFPDSGAGFFVSGGSAANLTGLAVARRVRLADDTEGAVIYCSDQTHDSVPKSIGVLGFSESQIRTVRTVADFSIDLEALEREVQADRRKGFEPFCVVANAGTTNTGAVDPLPELRSLCDREAMWLHADGAYGAAAAISSSGAACLEGIDTVDSLSIDPHKWLFQPFEIGGVLVRERDWLAQTFHSRPDYLKDVSRHEEEVCFADYGTQLTRNFRALKLWMSLKVFGVDAFAEAVERGFRLAELAQQEVSRSKNLRLVTDARMGIVCFEVAGLSDRVRDRATGKLVDLALEDGYAMISSTRLGDRAILRMCTINPRTTEMDIRRTVENLDELAGKVSE